MDRWVLPDLAQESSLQKVVPNSSRSIILYVQRVDEFTQNSLFIPMSPYQAVSPSKDSLSFMILSLLPCPKPSN